MRTSTDCTSRAEECRKLAKLAGKAEDCLHFLEMAATWNMLAKQRKADKQVADEEIDEQVADEEVAEKVAAEEEGAEEQVADEEVADEEVADEQLAAILALAGAIANGRDLRLGPVD
jgi:hypothetical protein